jgi:spore coat-associated protein N
MTPRASGRANHFAAKALLPLSLLTLLAVSASGGLFTGAFGYFTSSAIATISIAHGGSIGLSWRDTAVSGSDLAIDVGPLMPSDIVQRIGDLANTGSVSVRQIQLSVTGTGTGSDSDGIQLAIDRCSVPWVWVVAGYSCPATITPVSPDRPVKARMALTGSPAAVPAGLDHLRFSFRLPDSAPESAQGLSGSVQITVTGSSG